MKSTVLLPPLGVLLSILVLALPEAQAAQTGLLLLARPVQYGEFLYDFRDQRSDFKTGRSTSSDLNRLSQAYSIGLPFAILNPDIFVGNINARVQYEEDFFSSSIGPASESTALNLNYGVTGAIQRRKPLSVSFFANSQKNWVQQEFVPGYDATTTNYGATVLYKHNILPLTLRYNHEENDFTDVSGPQNYRDDTVSMQSSHRYRDFMQTTANLQDRWVRNIHGFSSTVDTLEERNASIGNSVSWKLSNTTPGYLASSASYTSTTGVSLLNAYQITESLSQALGKALKSGASYSYSVQESPLDSVHAHAANLFLNHQLLESLRTQINFQGHSSQLTSGTQNQLSGTGTLSYQKRLPNNSAMQLQASESYQWNEQHSNSSVRTQFNEKIKIVDIAQRYPLSNIDVITIVEVWNIDHTIKYQDTADFSIDQFGNLTFISVNATGQIRTGDVLLVTYQYQFDSDLTVASNSVSVSGNLSLVGSLCHIFAQFSETQQYLLKGQAQFAVMGSSTNTSVGVDSTIGSNKFGVKYTAVDNPVTSQDSIDAFWWYTGVIGINQLKLSLTDSYSISTDKATGRQVDNNSLNAAATLVRQFSQSAQGSLMAGYIKTQGFADRDSVYAKLNYMYRLGKFQLILYAQSLLNSYSNVSLFNNTVHLLVRRYF